MEDEAVGVGDGGDGPAHRLTDGDRAVLAAGGSRRRGGDGSGGSSGRCGARYAAGPGDVGHVGTDQGPGQADGAHVGLFLDVKLVVLDRDARGGDADQLAVPIESGATGVSVGDLGVGLDPLLAAGLEVFAEPAAHETGGEGHGRSGDARIADDGDEVAWEELVRIPDRHRDELERFRDRCFIGKLDDLEDGEVVGRIAGHIPGPVAEDGRLVGKVRIGRQNSVKLEVLARVELTDDVKIGQDISVWADDGSRSRPGSHLAAGVVEWNDLHHRFENVLPDLFGDALGRSVREP